MSELLIEILRAEHRIRPHIRETPLAYSESLSSRTGASVWLKLENFQHTGSFKTRGALNKLLSLPAAERSRGVVTASTGNHGAAVAFGMRELGGTGLIFVPAKAEPSKLERIRNLGSRVEVHGEDSGVTEVFARDYARGHSLTYVPPYNDVQVMAGQGTVGVELLRQGGPPDGVFVAMGGGGLIGGMATYLRALHPETVMVGCSPDNSKVLIESIRRGKVLDLPSLPTLSDGTAGGVETDAITFAVCRDLVQEFEVVTEEEIADAMRLMAERQHIVVEGAAGVAVAALLRQQERWRGKRVVVVICGGNVGSGVLKQVLGS